MVPEEGAGDVMATAVLESLVDLTPEELREVATRASYLLDPSKPAAAAAPAQSLKIDEDTRLVWNEMESVLRRALGADNVPPLPVMLRGRKGTLLREAVAAVLKLVAEGFKVKHRAERVKAIRLIVGLTAEDLNRRNALVPFRLTQRLRYCERTVDRHFPGYRAANLLSVVITRVRGD